MIVPRKLSVRFVGWILVAGLATARTVAAENPAKPQTEYPPISELTQSGMLDIIRAIAAVDPAFRTFALRFPNTKPMLIREKASSPRIMVSVTHQADEFTVMFQVSANLSRDLTKATEPRRDHFQAMFRVRSDKTGKTELFTMPLPWDDMTKLCQDPTAYLRARVEKAAKQR